MFSKKELEKHRRLFAKILANEVYINLIDSHLSALDRIEELGESKSAFIPREVVTKDTLYKLALAVEALGNLLQACDLADMDGDLSAHIDGSLLDNARQTLQEIGGGDG